MTLFKINDYGVTKSLIRYLLIMKYFEEELLKLKFYKIRSGR
jgi:hypothetical protein